MLRGAEPENVMDCDLPVARAAEMLLSLQAIKAWDG
jgi:hypothetical protein